MATVPEASTAGTKLAKSVLWKFTTPGLELETVWPNEWGQAELEALVVPLVLPASPGGVTVVEQAARARAAARRARGIAGVRMGGLSAGRRAEARATGYWISRGIDERPVRANRIRRSVGAESTFRGTWQTTKR